MKVIPLTKGYQTVVDDPDFEWLSAYKWHVSIHSGKPYARRAVWDSKEKRAKAFLMHREILGLKGSKRGDHIDGNSLNNSRSNLRPATIKQNQRNRLSVKGSSSRFVGVSWDKEKKLWTASINGRRLGRYKLEEDAAIVYDVASQLFYGSFGNLNFPIRSLPSA